MKKKITIEIRKKINFAIVFILFRLHDETVYRNTACYGLFLEPKYEKGERIQHHHRSDGPMT